MNELSSPSTREIILDTAEALFARQGHDGTSMRQITSEAGVNLAAVNYHFGSKEALVQAVLKRRLAILNQERLRLLDQLEAEAGGEPLKPRSNERRGGTECDRTCSSRRSPNHSKQKTLQL